MTMIFVTHDQQEAFAIGDKILLMDHGHIQQIDNGQGLYSHPKNQFVLNFIGESNMLSKDEYIRPENITLKKDNAGKGTITQVIFQGATVDYRINYQRKNFKVTCLNQVDNFQVGDRVAVSYQTKKLEEK
jgi:ABC-type spermidine/putrescine transport systems, ATPase components